MSAGRSIFQTGSPSKDKYAAPLPVEYATARTQSTLQGECLQPANRAPFPPYSAEGPELSQPSSVRGHPQCSRHNHSHPATRHSSGSRPDSSPDAAARLAEPPKTRALFWTWIILVVLVV